MYLGSMYYINEKKRVCVFYFFTALYIKKCKKLGYGLCGDPTCVYYRNLRTFIFIAPLV